MNLVLLDKLFSKTKFVDKCWLWSGTIHNEYGQIGINYKYYKVHRLALTIFHRLDYKDGQWQANHICDNKSCWNPLHVYAGTQLDNMQDSIKAGNHLTAGIYKTHCPKGHEYTEENTRIYNGKRHCRQCDRERKR